MRETGKPIVYGNRKKADLPRPVFYFRLPSNVLPDSPEAASFALSIERCMAEIGKKALSGFSTRQQKTLEDLGLIGDRREFEATSNQFTGGFWYGAHKPTEYCDLYIVCEQDLVLAESKSLDYDDDIPSPEAAVTPPLRMRDKLTPEILEAAEREIARRRGLSIEQVRAVLDAISPTAPAATAPASEIERKLAAAAAEAVARRDGTLYGSIQRHREERESLPLPEGGYTNPDDAHAAARLANNFSRLQKRLKDAGIERLPPDDVVRDAQRLSKAFFRTAGVA